MEKSLHDTYASEYLTYISYQFYSIITKYNSGLVYGLFFNNDSNFMRVKQGLENIFHYDVFIPDYLFAEFKNYMSISSRDNEVWYDDEEILDFIEAIQKKCFIDEIITDLV